MKADFFVDALGNSRFDPQSLIVDRVRLWHRYLPGGRVLYQPKALTMIINRDSRVGHCLWH